MTTNDERCGRCGERGGWHGPKCRRASDMFPPAAPTEDAAPPASWMDETMRKPDVAASVMRQRDDAEAALAVAAATLATAEAHLAALGGELREAEARIATLTQERDEARELHEAAERARQKQQEVGARLMLRQTALTRERDAALSRALTPEHHEVIRALYANVPGSTGPRLDLLERARRLGLDRIGSDP